MTRTSMRRFLGFLTSVGAAAVLAGGPLALAVRRPFIKPADTAVVNAGITVNAENPSDDVHLVSGGVDTSNHQISSAHPNGTADFVILLLGISNNNGNNFTAPITASWHTQPGSFTSFTAQSGVASFPSKYALHYQFVKVPVHYDATLFNDPFGSYESFYLVIGSATNATIGRGTATELVVKGPGSPKTPLGSTTSSSEMIAGLVGQSSPAVVQQPATPAVTPAVASTPTASSVAEPQVVHQVTTPAAAEVVLPSVTRHHSRTARVLHPSTARPAADIQGHHSRKAKNLDAATTQPSVQTEKKLFEKD